MGAAAAMGLSEEKNLNYHIKKCELLNVEPCVVRCGVTYYDVDMLTDPSKYAKKRGLSNQKIAEILNSGGNLYDCMMTG
jgi:hypothetical protein